MLALLGAQVSDALRRPQPRDEWILTRALWEIHPRGPAHRATGRLSVEAQYRIAAPVITGQHHEILACKYVHRSRWVHLEKSYTVGVNADVRHQRARQTAGDD